MLGNTHLVDSLLSLGVDVVKVFSPEHGFRGTADAGAKVLDGIEINNQDFLLFLYTVKIKSLLQNSLMMLILFYLIYKMLERVFTLIFLLFIMLWKLLQKMEFHDSFG